PEAVEYIRSVSADFGTHDQAGWEALTQHVMIQHQDRWVKHYDLRIAHAMAEETPQAVTGAAEILWPAFESLRHPVLIVRGETSDLLTPQTADQMLSRHGAARLFTVPQ